MENIAGERKLFTPKLVNVSQLVYSGACVVGGITISGDGAAGDCDVYDGVNTLAERKFHLEVLTGVTFSTGALQDNQFNHGIYIVVNAVTTFVTVSFRPPDEKKEEKAGESK
uniref:Uncharacterized protein n=1 Tax=viral metagenome TaxID=1070528 RepID=A0A6M3JK37_9ZZZZ